MGQADSVREGDMRRSGCVVVRLERPSWIAWKMKAAWTVLQVSSGQYTLPEWTGRKVD